VRKWLSGLVLVAVVVAGGLALTLDDGERPELRDDFHRGLSLTGYSRDEYGNLDAARATRDARALGAEWLTITPAWYQSTPEAHDVHADAERTPSEDSVETAIRRARRNGFKVALKPHLNMLDGTYRGEIAPEDVASWFRIYSLMLQYYADIAERTGVSELVVGTELEGVSGHTARWRQLIRRLRDDFSGTLTYAANYDEVLGIDFWDALDTIGVDAYFPLSKSEDPSVSELTQAWTKPLDRLERLHRRWDKQVFMTEVGYPSAESAVRTPYEEEGAQDLELQKRAVEAGLTAFAERPWIGGTTWWEWWSQPSALEEDDTGFALNGKPAAGVIQEWYSE
jgi:hypothetical protein